MVMPRELACSCCRGAPSSPKLCSKPAKRSTQAGARTKASVPGRRRRWLETASHEPALQGLGMLGCPVRVGGSQREVSRCQVARPVSCRQLLEACGRIPCTSSRARVPCRARSQAGRLATRRGLWAGTRADRHPSARMVVGAWSAGNAGSAGKAGSRRLLRCALRTRYPLLPWPPCMQMQPKLAARPYLHGMRPQRSLHQGVAQQPG